ncbi:MAG: hypothetical protein EBX50_21745 [Chitinophagia bacterium]|nr:hypothetical protein [Chitinophagia bacterium]
MEFNPLTVNEFNKLDDKTILQLYKQKSKKLYPFCLIGLEYNVANEKLKQWNKEMKNKTNIILLKDGEGFVMETITNNSYWYCKLNSDNVIVELYEP